MANYSRTVVSVPRPPTPNMFAKLFTPLSRSTFGRLPEQEWGGESRVSAARGRGFYLDGAGGRGTETTVLLRKGTFKQGPRPTIVCYTVINPLFAMLLLIHN